MKNDEQVGGGVEEVVSRKPARSRTLRRAQDRLRDGTFGTASGTRFVT
jgi:hypothetical protein